MSKSMLYKCKRCDKLLDRGHDCLDCLKKNLKIEEKIPNLNLTIIGTSGKVKVGQTVKKEKEI